MRMELAEALDMVEHVHGSDLLISAFTPPRLRRDGELQELDERPLTPADTELMLRSVLTIEQWRELEKRRHVDFAFTWREAARIRGNQFGGQVLLYARYVEDARPYLEASRDIDRAAVAFIVDHPRWYLGSVADAMIDFFSPPLRLVAGASNLVRQRAPALWLSVSGVYVLVMVAGFIAVFMQVSPWHCKKTVHGLKIPFRFVGDELFESCKEGTSV